MPDWKDITIRLPDGYESYGRYWCPETVRGSILYLHGIQSHCGWYEDSARVLVEAGYAVLQPDRRGSGHNSERRGHADSPRQILDDSRACLEELQRLSGMSQSHVLGISWGGKQAAAMYADNPAGIASLQLITPGIFPIVDVSAQEKVRIGFSMVSNPNRYFDIPLNDPEFFTDTPRWIEWLNKDDLRLFQATASFFLTSRRLDRVARKMFSASPVPVRLFLAGDERVIDNDQTTKYFERLGWPDTKVYNYRQARHTLEFQEDPGGFFKDLTSGLEEIDNRGHCPSHTL